jgi:aspartate/methionine/tyrosine aminotransferase
MNLIQPFRVMEVLGRAFELERQGRSVIHMEVGEPDFDTPAPVVQAGIRALQAGKTHYTASAGLTELREAIARYYDKRFRVDIDPRRILITPGSSAALQMVTLLLVDPGSRMMLSDPGYPCNRNFIHMAGGVPQALTVDASSAFQPTLEQVQREWRDDTCAALVATPANPTGTCIAKTELARIGEYVAAQRARLVVDEIYQGLTYEAESYSALSLSDALFVVNSFSKYFGMTGWRVGWLVAPADYVDDLHKLAQNLYLAAPTPAQHAAVAAFDDATIEILEQRRAVFQQRRDFLVPALEALGFGIAARPEGAFYIYADCAGFTDDSLEFARRLLEQAGVAVTPGLDFGRFNAARHLRFAYTTALENLEEGVERLRRFLSG